MQLLSATAWVCATEYWEDKTVGEFVGDKKKVMYVG